MIMNYVLDLQKQEWNMRQGCFQRRYAYVGGINLYGACIMVLLSWVAAKHGVCVLWQYFENGDTGYVFYKS